MEPCLMATVPIVLQPEKEPNSKLLLVRFAMGINACRDAVPIGTRAGSESAAKSGFAWAQVVSPSLSNNRIPIGLVGPD